jgi:hypothetical protein
VRTRRRRIESRGAAAGCARISVAGGVVVVVVKCAGRGRWSSDTNGGLATGRRELVVDKLNSGCRNSRRQSRHRPRQTQRRRRGTGSDAVHSKVALRSSVVQAVPCQQLLLDSSESEFKRFKGLLLGHARLCSSLVRDCQSLLCRWVCDK